MNAEIAIVGMEAILGFDEGLDAFDRTIFDGIRHSAAFSPERPKKIRTGVRAEYREDCPRILDGTVSRSGLSLMRVVIDRALRGTLSDLTNLNRDDLALILVSEGELPDLEGDPERFLKEDSVFSALRNAQDLLCSHEVQGVVVIAVHRPDRRGNSPESNTGSKRNGLPFGEGAGAIHLKLAEKARKDQDRVYAVIEAVVAESCGLSSERMPSAQEVAEVSRKAFQLAGVGQDEIAYLEASELGNGEAERVEVAGLCQAYRSEREGLTCALGNVKANIGDCSAVAGLASIVKTVLCLYHRYIPATPGWRGPGNEEPWESSPFYVPTESRPWFVNRESPKRFAAVSSVTSREVAHLILSEDLTQRSRQNRYLGLVSPYCFPLAGNDRIDLTGQLNALNRTLETSVSLIGLAEENLATFQQRSQATYALMIVGHSKEELLREIQFMTKGVPDAFEKGKELKTPKGSFFTAHPLGEEGKVAFVYPGVGSAYVGLAHSTFHMFPELYDQVAEMTPDMGGLFKEEELYPRTQHRLTEEEIWKRELRLRKDIMTISECGMGFFGLYTMILRDFFKVTPDCAIGYSMGEPGMFASLGVWHDPMQLSERFRASPSFRENLHGEVRVAREYWNLNEKSSTDKKIWDSFTLQATRSSVDEAIGREDRVFLTIVNTADEVVIAGDPESCTRVIKELGCKHYPLGLNLAIHCNPTRLEYDRLVDLYSLPLLRNPGIKFYSSSCYKPIPLRSKAIAHSIAKAFCEPVDFPRLINQAYEDGTRLFIEIGSRKFCSNLIDKILKEKEHRAMAINVKGTKDQASLVRILAELVSHRVPVDLSPLF